jgi:hypothetical protein
MILVTKQFTNKKDFLVVTINDYPMVIYDYGKGMK